MLKYFLTAALALVCGSAFAETRVALVLGNSAYSKVAALPNPKNDAAAMAELFAKAGFLVTARTDLNIETMRRTMRDFAETAANADIAVIYYAGHGIEIDGVNYLLPIDATLSRDTDVEDEAMSMDRFMRTIEPAKKLRLVILDACRDNPFAQTMKRTVASRSVGRGLAKVEPTTSDTLIAFAAKAGSTAADGDGGNSPFTAALINNITAPGLDLRIALGRVRDEVLASTSRKQEPFVYGSLGGAMVSLVPAADPPALPSPVTDPAHAMRRDYELATQVGTQQAFESFLEAYPTGFYASLAKSQLGKIVAAKKAAAEAAEAKAKADAAAAAAATGNSDDAAKKDADANAKRAKAEAEAKARAAAAAERSRTREAESASRRARTRQDRERPDNVALVPRDSALPPRPRGDQRILSQEPPLFTLRPGTKLLLNDGKCPPGQITEMTAGNPRMQQRRQYRCVARR
jgi:uncharacterized caspase-like protein